MRARHILAAALCLALAACGQGKVYPKPIAHMHEVLEEIEDVPPVFGGAGPDVSLEAGNPSRVEWVLALDGSEVMRFVATLEPEGERKTRMVLDLRGVTAGSHGNVEERLKGHPEVRKLYLVAMTEQIESKLEERPFDITRTYGALAVATAANIGSITRRMDDMAEADNKRDAENIRKAYAEEAAGL